MWLGLISLEYWSVLKKLIYSLGKVTVINILRISCFGRYIGRVALSNLFYGDKKKLLLLLATPFHCF